MLEANSIFNESLYITLNPDVAEAKLRGLFNSGFDHFTQFGKFEKRSPSAYFDPSFYLAKNWDVAKAVEAGTMSSAFDHFRLFGQKENRDTSILFQNSYYLAHQSDVAAAVERDELTGIEHFVTFGIDEGRPSSPAFDVRYYLEHYPDLQAAGFGYREAIEHFFVYGLSEGRTSSPTFDVRYYLGHYPDLQAAGFNYQQAFQHFLVYGLQEGRQGCQPLPYGQDGLVVRDVVTGNPEFINPPSSFNQNEQQETLLTTPANSTNQTSQPGSTNTLPLPVTTPSDEIDNLVIPSDDSNDVIDETDNLGIPSDDSNDSSTQLTPTVTLPKTLMGLEKEPTTLPLDLPPNAGGANSHKNPAPKHLQFSTTEEEYYKNTSVRLKDAWVFDASGASDLDKVVFSLHKVGDKSEDKEDKNGAVGKEDKEDKENKNSTVGKEDKEDKDKQDQVGKQDKEDKENKNGAVGKEDKEDKEDNKDNQDKVGKEDNKDNQDEGEVDKESSKDDEATLPLQNMTVFNTYSKDDRWGWFNYSLSGLAPGKYQLKGVAYDKDGGKSNTAVAHFTVSDEELPMPLIGVIDTGFSANNPDIDYSRITLGKDLVDGDNNPLLQAGEGNEHGTHILGIIAATGNNGVGIYGMNDQAPLWLGRAIGSGKWAESLIEFVDAAKASGQPKALVNLSLDMTQVNPDGSVTTRYEFTPKEREALEYARQNGVLIVAAAGNDGDVMSVLGQASQEFDNIITVGAANGNQRADYSSFGYGLDIVTEGGTIENPIVSTVGDDVGTMAGTSVAAAQVTGAASLVWEANPGLNYRQVIEVLKSNATDLNTVGWDSETGAGFLNVDKAVEAAKAIAPEAYTPEPWVAPLTWSGEGKVTPTERAAADEFNGKYYDWVSYTVKSGDTLSQIALNTIGVASGYNFIAQHNGIANPDLIYVGQVIQIPKEVSAPPPDSPPPTNENDTPLPGEGKVPTDAGEFRNQVTSNGVNTYYYANGYLMTQPNGYQSWYNLGTGMPAAFTLPAMPTTFLPLSGFAVSESGSFSIGPSADGRLEAFVVEADKDLWQRWQYNPSGAGGWSNVKQVLDAQGKSLPVTKVTLARNADGRLEAFAIESDNDLWHRWQLRPNGGWSEWKKVLDAEGKSLPVKEVTVGQNANGRLELFAIETDGDLWQRWQVIPNGGWSEWKKVLDTQGKSLQVKEVEVAKNADGRLEVFAIEKNDNDLWNRSQLIPNGGWTEWKKVLDAQGKSLPVKEIEMARNADGRLELFAIETDGDLWQRWQLNPNGGWSEWKKALDAQGKSLPVKEIEVAQNADGRLEVFAIETDNDLWHRWQIKPNDNSWSHWSKFVGFQAKEVAISRNADGRLEAFATGLDDKLRHNWQKETNGPTGWNGWRLFSDFSVIGEDKPPVASSNDFKLPLPGGKSWYVTSGVGHSSSDWQYFAIDIDDLASVGQQYDVPVLAPSSGMVVKTGYESGGWGHFLKIDHEAPYNDGKGYITVYAHLKYAPSVTEGKFVTQGEQLGILGSTGNSSGSHLHFAVLYNDYNGYSSVPQLQNLLIDGRKLQDYKPKNYYLSTNY